MTSPLGIDVEEFESATGAEMVAGTLDDGEAPECHDR